MTSRRFCLPDAGYKGETICFWNLGVCLKPLLNLLCKAVVEHLKGKWRAGTPWSLHTSYMNRFMLGEGVCLLINVYIPDRIWSYIELSVWLGCEVWGRVVDPLLPQKFFFGYHYRAKKNLRVVQDQSDHFCSLIKTAWGMEPTGQQKFKVCSTKKPRTKMFLLVISGLDLEF